MVSKRLQAGNGCPAGTGHLVLQHAGVFSRLLDHGSCTEGGLYGQLAGDLVGQATLPGGATTNPVVAGGTLYVVSARGQLHAFR